MAKTYKVKRVGRPTKNKVEEYMEKITTDTPDTTETKKTEPEVAEKPEPLTAEQAEIANVIMSSDKEWETIGEESMVDFSLSKPAYPIPKEAEELQKKKEFAFRYIENNLARLQQVMRQEVPYKWWPCNSTNTPYLQKYIDKTDGAVHCQDQILVFKPWWMHEKYKQIVTGRSRTKTTVLDSKHGAKEADGSKWTSDENAKIVDGKDEVMEVADDM